MKLRTPFLSAALGLLCSGVFLSMGRAQVPSAFFLKDGDRVVFYGDSITEQKLYTNFVETFVLTRFPELKIDFINAGWSGDRVGGGGGGPIDVRLARDVFPYKPTVMTMMLGMNDGNYVPLTPEILETYTKGYLYILDRVIKEAPDIRFTLIMPSPFDDVTRPPAAGGGYNSVMLKFSDFIRKTADEKRLVYADFNTPVVDMLTKATGLNPGVATGLIPDRVHPSPAAHVIMAGALLKAWNAPALVSEVEIDAIRGQAIRTADAEVSDLKGGDEISWKQQDKRLPFPVDFNDQGTALMLQSSDFTNEFNREILKVAGLSKKNHTLFIDGQETATFSGAEFEKGINLAGFDTPMMQAAMQVAALTRLHNEKHQFRWRNMEISLGNEADPEMKTALQGVLAGLDRQEKEVVNQARAAAQPKPHVYEIKAAFPKDATNLALHKTFVTSDPNNGWMGLTDGSKVEGVGTTFATGAADVFPKTATIDLGSVESLVEVTVTMPGFGSTKTVKVLLSEDGEKFKEVGEHVFALGKTQQFPYRFPAEKARYIQINYPDHYAEQAGFDSHFIFTSEVEAYGPPK